MPLVIDANVVFSCVISRDRALDTVFGLYDKGVALISPEYLFEEIERNRRKIVKCSGLSSEEVAFFVSNLFSEFISPVPESKYACFLEEARTISPDLKDAPYFAVSLSYDKSPIWSREPRLAKQKHIKVLTDGKVRAYFGIKEEL